MPGTAHLTLGRQKADPGPARWNPGPGPGLALVLTGPGRARSTPGRARAGCQPVLTQSTPLTRSNQLRLDLVFEPCFLLN